MFVAEEQTQLVVLALLLQAKQAARRSRGEHGRGRSDKAEEGAMMRASWTALGGVGGVHSGAVHHDDCITSRRLVYRGSDMQAS